MPGPDAWSEHRFIARDKTPLFYRRLKVSGSAKANLIILHGMGEHGGRYKELAEYLAGKDIASVIPDLRGFGKSGGKRGCVGHFSDYAADLDIIRRLEPVDKARVLPLFILGHSFGGLVATSWVSSNAAMHCRGLVLTSPCFGLAESVPWYRHWTALAVSMVYKDFTEANGVNPDLLSHDPAKCCLYKTDPMIHHRISAGLYRELMTQFDRVNEMALNIHCSTLLLQAGDDRVVSRRAAESFFKALKVEDKELHIYESLYHEILNEIERPAIFNLITDWMQSRLGQVKNT